MVFWLLHQNKLKNNTGTLAILVDIDIFSMCVWAIIQSEYLFILFLISTKGIFGAQWWLRWKIPVRNNNQNTIAYKKNVYETGISPPLPIKRNRSWNHSPPMQWPEKNNNNKYFSYLRVIVRRATAYDLYR